MEYRNGRVKSQVYTSLRFKSASLNNRSQGSPFDCIEFDVEFFTKMVKLDGIFGVD